MPLSRIPYPNVEAISQEQREAITALGHFPLNVTWMGFHLPEAFWRTHYDFKLACVYATTLDQRLREILILRTAYLSNSEYEIHHHISISTNLGFTREMQDDIREARYDRLSEVERTVAEFTDEVVVDVRASDATFAKVREHFSDSVILEMLVLIGSYMATARIAATLDVELDAHAVQGWKKTS